MVAEFKVAPLWPMVAAQTQAELRRLLRVSEFTGFGLAFPLILYVFIGLQGSGPGAADYHKYALASMCAYAVVNIALSTFGISVANERGSRMDALLRATPVRPIAQPKIPCGLTYPDDPQMPMSRYIGSTAIS